MKLAEAPSKIVGVRVGELSVDMLKATKLSVHFILLRDPEKSPGINAGKYSKEQDFSPRVLDALHELLSALEEDVLPELFDVPDDRLDVVRAETDKGGFPALEKEDEDKDGLKYPTLGGSKGTPQF